MSNKPLTATLNVRLTPEERAALEVLRKDRQLLSLSDAVRVLIHNTLPMPDLADQEEECGQMDLDAVLQANGWEPEPQQR